MRTIKFRGKDIETGEWIYGHFFQRLGHYPTIVKQRLHNGKVMCYEIVVEDTTVDQFTGLYDKNGREIYEGDILRFGSIQDDVCEVKWNETICAFCIRFYLEYKLGSRPLGEWLKRDKNVIIIGNIHDNPELLKGGEK